MASGTDDKEGKPTEGDDALFYLETANPSITQPIESGEALQQEYKFVQIEIIEVHNPKKKSLIFQVYFRPKNTEKEKLYLGSFSLYPPDNPGKFIVATQGKVKDKGAIVLSMVLPEHLDPHDEIRVTVKKIRLLKKS